MKLGVDYPGRFLAAVSRKEKMPSTKIMLSAAGASASGAIQTGPREVRF